MGVVAQFYMPGPFLDPGETPKCGPKVKLKVFTSGSVSNGLKEKKEKKIGFLKKLFCT